MVDFLKRAVEDLEAPLCQDCDIPMLWFRSLRMSLKVEAVVHVFQCPNCHRLREIRSKSHGRTNGNTRKASPPSHARAA
jgi:hypothetical protein